jgi:hypothetical protein
VTAVGAEAEGEKSEAAGERPIAIKRSASATLHRTSATHDDCTHRLLAVGAEDVDVEPALGRVEQRPARPESALAPPEPVGALPAEADETERAVAAARRTDAARGRHAAPGTRSADAREVHPIPPAAARGGRCRKLETASLTLSLARVRVAVEGVATRVARRRLTAPHTLPALRCVAAVVVLDALALLLVMDGEIECGR